jgi:hypothetical protein
MAGKQKDFKVKDGLDSDSETRTSKVKHKMKIDTDTIYVDADNNFVGIGTLTPTTALDVNGTVKATLFSGNSAGLTGIPDFFPGLQDNGTVPTLKIYDGWTTWGSTGIYAFYNSLNTGTFTISGGDNYNKGSVMVLCGGDHATVNSDIYFKSNGDVTECHYDHSEGEWGFIGNKILTTGQITAASFNATSNRDQKDFVEAYSLNHFEGLLDLQPIKYLLKEDENDDTHIGFYADEMYEIIPEIVSIKDGKAVGIDYSRLVVPLLLLVKDLKERLDKAGL